MSKASVLKLKNNNGYSRGKMGKREDLGNIFFRSSWEANYARILNYENKKWQFEPITFNLEPGVTYTPDFVLEDGTIIEVKGWLTEKGKMKLDKFMESVHYQEDKFVYVDKMKYKELQNQYQFVIQGWEK